MFIVPLSGDKVQTAGGVAHTVLSYTNYKDQPAVYVEGDEASDAKSVSFSDIVSVNGTPVKVGQGGVLVSTGHVKRAVHLPQKDDIATCAGMHIKVKSLKLGERGKLASGMLVVGTNDDKEPVSGRIADLEEIEIIGKGKNFNRKAFQAAYKDYLGGAV